MTKNRIRILCMVMVLTMAVLGVVAFADGTQEAQEFEALQSAEFDIVQIEQERDGSGNLVPFTQNKKLLPAVYSGNSFPVSEDESGFWNGDVKNTIDKYVTVANIGQTNAYFRTVIAVESDEANYPGGYLIKFNLNTDSYDWISGVEGATQYNGVGIIENVHIDYNYDSNRDGLVDIVINDEYDILVGTYKGDNNGVLAEGITSEPSLLQVAMDKNADGKYVEQFGETFEILVFTQAVQVPHDSANMSLLDALGGKITSTNHPWQDISTVPEANTSADADNNN